MLVRLLLLSACALSVVAQGTRVEFEVLPEGTLETRLRLASPKVKVRLDRLTELYAEAGCGPEVLIRQPVKWSKEPNLICTIQGETIRKIVVGAHYDSAGGDGVIDNWTGAILLPSLYQLIRKKPRRHTFEFVGFAAEEKGLYGSESYVKAIPKEKRPDVAAVITMDSLGLSPLKYWPSHSDPNLALRMARLALSMKQELVGINADEVGNTDSDSFRKARIPVLSLHSITQEKLYVINGNYDVWKAVSWKDYYDTYRLISAYLVYLDQTLP